MFRLSLTRAALTAGLITRALRVGGAKLFESGWARLEGVSAAGGASGGTTVAGTAADSGSFRGIFEGGCNETDSGSGLGGIVLASASSAKILFGPETDSDEPSATGGECGLAPRFSGLNLQSF